MSMTPAMESIFANAQQNAASLIETATLAIHSKVNTIEEAEQMIQELSSEAVKYNELLTTIMNAMRQVESGDMQKEEAAGIIAPAVKELKDKCTALKIANAEAPGDDITEDEIAILRELIIGAKAAAEDRLVAIRLGDDDKVDPEVEAEVNTPDDEECMSSTEVVTEAAFLAAKLPHLNNMNEERRRIAQKYLDGIKNEEVILPYIPEYANPVWHIFAIRCKRRDELEKFLNDAGIGTNKHYPIPMHLQECYNDFGFKEGDFPIAEEISATELSIPMYYGMSDEEVQYVIEKVNEFR